MFDYFSGLKWLDVVVFLLFFCFCGLMCIIYQEKHFTHFFSFFTTLVQAPGMSLIHRACTYGELDTLTDLIEVKGIDPCKMEEVSI